MNPGKLDRRVVIQRRIILKDETGSRFETWADQATVWAEYVTARGTETTLADADRSQVTQQFRIRHRSITTTDHRILYRLKFYDIRSISEEAGRWNTLLLETVSTQSAP